MPPKNKQARRSVRSVGWYIYIPRERLYCIHLLLFEFARFECQRLTHENVLLCKITPAIPFIRLAEVLQKYCF